MLGYTTSDNYQPRVWDGVRAHSAPAGDDGVTTIIRHMHNRIDPFNET